MTLGSQWPALMVAIVHANRPPWASIATDGQGTTWLSGPSEGTDVPVFYIQGAGPSWAASAFDATHERLRWQQSSRSVAPRLLRAVDFVGTYPFRRWVPRWHLAEVGQLPRPSLIARVPDTYLTAVYKELALFDFFLSRTTADWLYMTTSSSYVRVDKLLATAGSLSPSRVYAGTRIVAGRREFASGANRLFSRDVVDDVFRSRTLWDRSLLEDLGLGKLAERLGLSVRPLPSLNIDSVAEVWSLPVDILAGSFHYRVKSGPLDRRNDVGVMRALHERILSEGL